MTTTNERVAITPAEDATIIKRGEFTEIAIWRSEYNGQRQVSVAQRHPKRTGGYWSTRQPIVYDAELSAAFMKQAIGHTLLVNDEGVVTKVAAIEAPAAKGRARGKAVSAIKAASK